MIRLDSIVKRYGQDINDPLAVDNVTIEFDYGKLYAIVGKSGSGKTTLLNIIAGLLSPTSGYIYLEGVDISNYNEKEKAAYRNKKIGYVFQSFYLEPKMSVLDNVCLPMIIAGEKKNVREEKAKVILEQLGLLEYLGKKVSKMSGGEQQRVAIARALINDASIILADEPTGNLDTQNGIAVMEEIKRLSNAGKLVILVTHNLEHAHKYADVILELSDGKIIREEINENY